MLEIGGQEAGGALRTCSVELPPRERLEIEERFFSLSYVHAKSSPQARIGIRSPVRQETHLVDVEDWGDLWVRGMDLYLVGYLTREEFSRRAGFVPAGTRVFQYDYNETRLKNLAVPLSELKPLSELLERVKSR